MLDILAASYKNIGPMCDHMISLCFHKGTYLIKAPVGVGKSFLFFDGPIFSLYKHSPRLIRNRRSSEAYTQLLFVIEGKVWLIHRVLTATKKGGDSVKSILYSVEISGEEMNALLSQYDTFFEDALVDILASYLEPISFATEKELDATLADLLPPKEVVLSAHFLMQDADNIFELAPGDRLEVFKHIFGFIGIDHAKEQLREKRKEVQTTITIKGDISDLQRTFTAMLSETKTYVEELYRQKIPILSIQQGIDNLLETSVLRDVHLLSGDIQLSGFTCDIDEKSIDSLCLALQEQKDSYTRIITQKEETEKYYQKLQQEKNTTQKTIQELIEEKKRLVSLSSSLDVATGTTLQQTAEQQNKVLHEKEDIYVQRCRQLGYTVDTFVDVLRIVDDMIATGKQLQVTIEFHEKQLSHLEQHHEETKKRKRDIEQHLVSLHASYEEQSVFRCDKIAGDCPYVELIKGSSLRTLLQQKTIYQEQQVEIDRLIVKEGVELQQQRSKLQELSLKKEQQLSLLVSLQWKEIYEVHKIYQQLQQEYAKTLEHIEEYQRKKALLDEQQKKLQTVSLQEELLTQQIEKWQQPEEEYRKLLESYTQQLQHVDVDQLVSLYDVLVALKDKKQRLEDIVQQYTTRQQEVLVLEEQQKQLKQLYTIFSKELLIIVLQDFLPIIQSTMNSYLAEVAEYTLLFELEHSASDTVTLEIYVEDSRGKRAVKSLSGGQKSLLKLAWIFSIATMLQLPFLFLDETITSLDAVTTSHVADVLHRFVQEFTTKLYVITHSPQIQDMHIWDKEIQIDLQ